MINMATRRRLQELAYEDGISIKAVPCKPPRGKKNMTGFTNWFHVKLIRPYYDTFAITCGFGLALPDPDVGSVLEIALSDFELYREKTYMEYLEDYALDDTEEERRDWRKLGRMTIDLQKFIGTDRMEEYAEGYLIDNS
jgi:hypothetical protein